MPKFLNNRVYRIPFLLYTVGLFFVCLIVCVSLISLIVSNKADEIREQTLRTFKDSEYAILSNTQKIDRYFLRLYADGGDAIFQDFMRFLENDAEGYMTKRLLEVSAYGTQSSFIDDIKSFVSSNDYQVRKISFVTPENVNVILFEPNGSSQVQFQVTGAAREEEIDISRGYDYVRKIPQPDNAAITLGEVHFLVSSEAIFPPPGAIGASAIMSKGGALYFGADAKTQQDFQDLYSNGYSQGANASGLLMKQHYSVFTSEDYDFKMLSLVSTAQIMQASGNMILLVILSTVFIFVSVTMLISVSMTYNSHYLTRIVQAIDDAKHGKFNAIRIEKRKDEYSIIAENLNDMYKQLQEYIEREYILKLRQIEAEMKILQQQINPHFLYNTLEVIRSCALVNNDGLVAEAIYNLGGMFRAIVKQEDTITFQAELDVLSMYLKIMEFRYRGRFFYQIDVEESILPTKTVKLWMQPLVENYFVHGFHADNEYNVMIIKGRVESGRFCIEFTNNGKSIDSGALPKINQTMWEHEKEAHLGVGLQNVYSRLCYFYGQDVDMNIRNNEDAGVTVWVRLPANVKMEGETSCIGCS